MESERGNGIGEPATGPSGGAVAAHLARMHAQRVTLFEALAGVPEGRLWERAAPRKGSPGEHLDHARVLNRSFRRLLTLAWPVVSPWPALVPAARRRLGRPYPTRQAERFRERTAGATELELQHLMARVRPATTSGGTSG